MSVAELLCVKRGGGKKKQLEKGKRWEAKRECGKEGGNKIEGIESGLVRESK